MGLHGTPRRPAGSSRGLDVVVLVVVLVSLSGVGALFQPFPAYFVFGDSLVDAGNNNYITTVAKASNLPFGIDFPAGPTGRFTNGRTTVDVLCDLLSLPYSPPYLAPTTKGAAILTGVSYASAASGIVRRTGYDFLGRADFDTQLTWFSNTLKQLDEQLGESGRQELIKKSFFSVTFGANDYVNNYLLRGSPTPLQYNPSQFQELLIKTLKNQLTELYNLGPRTIAVTDIGPIGCIPEQLARYSKNGECSDSINKLAVDFNAQLKIMLAQLGSELPGSNFVYAGTFDLIFDYRTNPTKYGFEVGDRACCGAGKFNGNVLCLPGLKPCPNRADYVFFDCFHPSQHTNELLAQSLFDTLKDQLLKGL